MFLSYIFIWFHNSDCWFMYNFLYTPLHERNEPAITIFAAKITNQQVFHSTWDTPSSWHVSPPHHFLDFICIVLIDAFFFSFTGSVNYFEILPGFLPLIVWSMEFIKKIQPFVFTSYDEGLSGSESFLKKWSQIESSQHLQYAIFYALCAAYALISTVALV